VNEIVAFIEKHITQGVESIQTEQQGTAAQPASVETGASDALKAKM